MRWLAVLLLLAHLMGVSADARTRTIQRDGEVWSVWEGGRLCWQARDVSLRSEYLPSAKSGDDSLTLIASWECPGRTYAAGKFQVWDLNANAVPDLSYDSQDREWPPDSTYVYEALADNVFQLMHQFPSPPEYWPWAYLLCAGDGDADSLAEMVYGSGTTGVPRNLIFMEPKILGEYPSEVVLTLPEENISVHYMRRADLDSDGRREYVGSTQGSGEMLVSIWENRGDNDFVQIFATHFGPSDAVAGEVAIGDFDGDGRQELVVPETTVQSRVIHVIECVGDDQYEEVWSAEAPTDNMYWATPGPDLDRDGRGDFVMTGGAGWGGDVVWSFLMYEAVGDNSYELVWSHQVHSGMIDGGSIAGDIDGDGWPELLSQVPNRTMLFCPVGDNQLELCWEHEGPVDGQRGHRIVPPDLDGDTRGEAIWWLSSDPGVLVIYEWVPQSGGIPETVTASRCLTLANPFRAGNRITYRLDHECYASVDILDALGRRVASLASGWHAAGRHSIRWEPCPNIPGVFFCRVSAPGMTETTKVIIPR